MVASVEDASGGVGEWVVVTEYPAAALQGVLAQGAGRLGLAQILEGAGQGGGCYQGGAVIRTVYPAAALQGVLA